MIYSIMEIIANFLVFHRLHDDVFIGGNGPYVIIQNYGANDYEYDIEDIGRVVHENNNSPELKGILVIRRLNYITITSPIYCGRNSPDQNANEVKC